MIRIIEKKVLIPTIFCQNKINISNVKNKLISDIEEGIKLKNNFSYKTNVKGQMTDWKYFNKNNEFISCLKNGCDDLIKLINLEDAEIESSWGIKISTGDYTKPHNHIEHIYSGILYLNDCEQEIIFDELNLKVKILEGTFLFFSGILKHYVDRNLTNQDKYAIAFNFKSVKKWN